jgi:hypothetical protein
MSNKIELIFPLIIIAVFVIRVVKAAMEQKASQDDDWESKDDWETQEWTDWQPSQAATPATPTRPPSPPAKPAPNMQQTLQSILAEAKMPPKAVVKAARMVPPKPPPPPAAARPQPDRTGTDSQPQTMAELPLAFAGTSVESSNAHQELAANALARAFAAAPRQIKAATGGPRNWVAMHPGNLTDLRRAVLWREVLERPRAFDL